MEWLFYIVSMLYTLVLIGTVGFTLFESYFSRNLSTEFSKNQQSHRIFMSKLLFVLILCSIFEQAILWLDQFGSERFDFKALFFDTLTGQVWVGLFVLTFIGLFIQKKSSIWLTIWALLLLLAESIDGHMAMIDSIAVAFNFIHMICATLWLGGIATFVLNWKKYKEELLPLMQSFMNIMWLTVIVMSISGLVLSMMILPDALYLLYSPWGQWLLIKVFFVCIALYCGYLVRKSVRKQALPIQKVLIIEVISLIVVITIAGIISIVSPEPSSNKLSHHEMGEELHYTIEISPNRPGPNEFMAKLWTLENEGEIQSVVVHIMDTEKGERTNRTLTLTEIPLDEPYNFKGFVESQYKYDESLRFPYPSTWKQDVTITFESGQTREFSFLFDN